MAVEFEPLTIIIDNGTDTVKAGIAGGPYAEPSVIHPTAVGKHWSVADKDFGYVPSLAHYMQIGAAALHDVNPLIGISRNCPIERGTITNLDDIQYIWDQIFSKDLDKDPMKHRVLMTEPPLHPNKSREKLTEKLFERWCIPRLFLANQAVLDVFSSGQTTGLALSSGAGQSYAVPVFEGHALPSVSHRAPIGGQDVEAYLCKLLSDKNKNITKHAKKIKEKLCYVKCAETANLFSDESYQLSDSVIDIGSTSFECTEVLFKPDLLENNGSHVSGLQQLASKSLAEVGSGLLPVMLRNIVLAGGSTMFPGFSERIKDELLSLSSPEDSGALSIHASEWRKFATWTGGSIMAAWPHFEQMWMTSEEYDEHGTNIVYRKCF